MRCIFFEPHLLSLRIAVAFRIIGFVLHFRFLAPFKATCNIPIPVLSTGRGRRNNEDKCLWLNGARLVC